MTPLPPTPVTPPPVRVVAARRPRTHPLASRLSRAADRRAAETPAAADPPCPTRTRTPLPVVLAALAALDDGDLHVAMTQAQRLLADRPAVPTDAGAAALRVEIVDAVEARLLAAHRARTTPVRLLHGVR